MFNGELFAQRLQKLIYLHSLTGCFMKISIQSSKQTLVNFALKIEKDGWMNGVLGPLYALSRLNWAGDNLG